MVLDEEYYRKLNESEQRFYGIINEIRTQMGMATVEVPFYGPKISTAEAPGKPEAIFEVPLVAIVEPNEDEIHPRSKNELQQQPESISRIVVGGFDDPKSTSFPSKLSEMSCNQGNQFGLFHEKDPSMSRELFSSNSLLQKPNSSCHEAIEDSLTKVDEDRQILYVSSMEGSSPSKTEDDLRKIDATIDTSTQEIVPSKIAQVGDGLFLDAHNLLEEMPMGDGSAKLQEMGDFEPLKVTSLPLLEEIDGASSKVVSASLTEFVVEPHFVLLNDDGLPIIENREYRYACPDIDVEWEKIFDGIQNSMREVMTGSIIPIKVRVSDRWASSMEFLVKINAHKVFVEKSRPSVHQLEPSEINLDEESQSVIDMVVDKHRLWNGNLIFDPGIAYLSSAIGSLSVLVLGSIREETSIDVLLSKDRRNWVFDPGGRWLLLSSDIGRQLQHLSLLHQLSAC